MSLITISILVSHTDILLVRCRSMKIIFANSNAIKVIKFFDSYLASYLEAEKVRES